MARKRPSLLESMDDLVEAERFERSTPCAQGSMYRAICMIKIDCNQRLMGDLRQLQQALFTDLFTSRADSNVHRRRGPGQLHNLFLAANRACGDHMTSAADIGMFAGLAQAAIPRPQHCLPVL
jgi:hypothetical protein